MMIDAHQHFWHYHPETHTWINDSMQVIRKDFLPEDLEPLLLENGIDGCIAVQADQSAAETRFLVDLSSKNKWICGVIGWVDLMSADIEYQLADWKRWPIVKGFRHILQAEEPEFMLTAEFLRGIAALQKFNYCYEILIYPKHLAATLLMVKQFPEMRFVIDHIAKPNIKDQQLEEWEKGIVSLGLQKNVFCKVSGMVTEANWEDWEPSNFDPYLAVIKNAFGMDRLIYGSDWPVCLIAANYKQQLSIYKQYFSNCTDSEKEMLFGGNAKRFYQI
ncbi:MAG: amidohydrolase family protein [Bacteroidota bacterium]